MEWILALRHEALTPVFLAFTSLGDPRFFLVFLAAGYWLGNREAFFRLTVLLTVSALINATLKEVFQAQRPEVTHLVDVGGWSFPSGHAQLAATLWPALAWQLRRRWAVAGATVLVIGVAASRVYLGVHFPEDVIAGTAIGLLLVSAARTWLAQQAAWWERLPSWTRAAAIAAVAAAWPVLIPGSPSGTALLAGGALIGFGTGHLIASSRVAYSPPKRTPLRVTALAAGLAGAFGLLWALAQPLAALGVPQDWSDFVRYAAVGIWVSFLAPALFRLARFAQ